MLVYLSNQPLGARLAAALHLGRLPRTCPPAGELAGVLAHLGGPAGVRALFLPCRGLRPEGWDAAGRRVFSAGPGTYPDVAIRALAGVARLAGVPAHAYLLAGVPDLPWPLGALAARGVRGAALACARLAWPWAAAAAARVAAGRADAGDPAATEPPAGGAVTAGP